MAKPVTVDSVRKVNVGMYDTTAALRKQPKPFYLTVRLTNLLTKSKTKAITEIYYRLKIDKVADKAVDPRGNFQVVQTSQFCRNTVKDKTIIFIYHLQVSTSYKLKLLQRCEEKLSLYATCTL